MDNSGKTATKKSASPIQPTLSAEEYLSLPIDELLARLDTTQDGLSSQEAEKRLDVYGRNELAREHEHNTLLEFSFTLQKPISHNTINCGINLRHPRRNSPCCNNFDYSAR